MEEILSKLDGDSILDTPGIRPLLIFQIETVHQANCKVYVNSVSR